MATFPLTVHQACGLLLTPTVPAVCIQVVLTLAGGYPARGSRAAPLLPRHLTQGNRLVHLGC